jgi:hypothetical protein
MTARCFVCFVCFVVASSASLLLHDLQQRQRRRSVRSRCGHCLRRRGNQPGPWFPRPSAPSCSGVCSAPRALRASAASMSSSSKSRAPPGSKCIGEVPLRPASTAPRVRPRRASPRLITPPGRSLNCRGAGAVSSTVQVLPQVLRHAPACAGQQHTSRARHCRGGRR